MFDFGHLLDSVSADSPAGDNLEYDPAFLELEQLAQGTQEAEFGDTVIAGAEPDWKAMRRVALSLSERTHDLRIAVYLARSGLELDAYEGLAAGLKILAFWLVEQWADVHPQLDPDDDLDPTMRVNVLTALVEPTGLLLAIQRAPLIDSAAGPIALRDIELATGEATAQDGVEPISLAVIDAAFAASDAPRLDRLHTALTQCREVVATIEAALTEHVGAAQSINLRPLSRMLTRIGDFVGERMQRRQGVGSSEATAEGGAGALVAGSSGSNGAIANRDDVVQMLDRLCAYYERHEPSSPVPLLLARAKRLAGMNFLEIIADMASEGTQQVHTVGGIAPAESDGY